MKSYPKDSGLRCYFRENTSLSRVESSDGAQNRSRPSSSIILDQKKIWRVSGKVTMDSEVAIWGEPADFSKSPIFFPQRYSSDRFPLNKCLENMPTVTKCSREVIKSVSGGFWLQQTHCHCSNSPGRALGSASIFERKTVENLSDLKEIPRFIEFIYFLSSLGALNELASVIGPK